MSDEIAAALAHMMAARPLSAKPPPAGVGKPGGGAADGAGQRRASAAVKDDANIVALRFDVVRHVSHSSPADADAEGSLDDTDDRPSLQVRRGCTRRERVVSA